MLYNINLDHYSMQIFDLLKCIRGNFLGNLEKSNSRVRMKVSYKKIFSNKVLSKVLMHDIIIADLNNAKLFKTQSHWFIWLDPGCCQATGDTIYCGSMTKILLDEHNWGETFPYGKPLLIIYTSASYHSQPDPQH